MVLAYADGKIELKIPKKSNQNVKGWRLAPKFSVVKKIDINVLNIDPNSKPYNAESIATFLGWMIDKQVSPRIRNALAVLTQAEELGAEEEITKITTGLGSAQAAFFVVMWLLGKLVKWSRKTKLQDTEP